MKILVQVRNKPYEGGKWLELPGGRVEEFESLVTALRREVREETGLEVTFIIYLNKSCLLIELWMVGMLAQAPRPFLLFSCSRNPSHEFWDTSLPSQAPQNLSGFLTIRSYRGPDGCTTTPSGD